MKEVSWDGRSHHWASPRTLPWCVGVSGRLKHGHLPDLLQAQERRNSKRENRKRGERKEEKEEKREKENDQTRAVWSERRASWRIRELASKARKIESASGWASGKAGCEWKDVHRIQRDWEEGSKRKREKEREGIVGRKQLLVRCNENISRPFRNRPTSVRRV